MFQRSSAARLEAMTIDQPRAPGLWGLRRGATPQPAFTSAPEDTAFIPDTIADGFETFGRSGLELGGLHRDQQWVGAWGGRC
jgi:hypothetical protein